MHSGLGMIFLGENVFKLFSLAEDIDAEAIRGVAKAMAGLANGGGAGGTMVVHDADGGGGGGFGTMVVNGDAAPGSSGGGGSMVVNPASASASTPSGASAVPAFIRQLVTGKAEQSLLSSCGGVITTL